MNSGLAHEFLTRCFSPGETIALLLRREEPVSVIQRIVTLEAATSARYLRWLAHENSAGANIYVVANPLRPGSRKRAKENIADLRHLYIDIDSEGDARIAELLASDRVPTPNAVVRTSQGKCQVIWRVTGLDFEQQEITLKQLAIAFGGDPACTDCNRVLRVPGFLNRKYKSAPMVTAEYLSDAVSSPQDFGLGSMGTIAGFPRSIRQVRKQANKHSASEADWAWVSRELAAGKDALNLTHELASRRPDKTKPVYYAQRTVDIASARLWLSNGIGIDDVITMLECRRRFDYPSMHCSGRAREIAQTARRMIARKQIA
jgi:hypothetical protein